MKLIVGRTAPGTELREVTPQWAVVISACPGRQCWTHYPVRRPLTLLALFTLATPAAAQSWDMDDFTVTFVDCVRKGTAQVACTFTSTYKGRLDQTPVAFQTSAVVAVTPNGQPVPSRTLTLAQGAPFQTYGTLPMFKGMPVRVVATFDYSAPGATLPRLSYSGHVLSDVALRGGAATPVAAPTPSAYTAVLTNCQASAGGTLTCTATLSPSK